MDDKINYCYDKCITLYLDYQISKYFLLRKQNYDTLKIIK